LDGGLTGPDDDDLLVHLAKDSSLWDDAAAPAESKLHPRSRQNGAKSF
jgi:hypothetical protein